MISIATAFSDLEELNAEDLDSSNSSPVIPESHAEESLDARYFKQRIVWGFSFGLLRFCLGMSELELKIYLLDCNQRLEIEHD